MNRPFIRLDKPSYKEVNYESGLFSFHLMPNSESTSNIDQLIIKQLISYKCVETSKKSNYNNLNEIYLDYIVRNPGNKTLFDSHWTNFSLEFRPFGYRFYYPKLIPVLIKNSKVDEAIQLSKTCRFSAGNMSYVLSSCPGSCESAGSQFVASSDKLSPDILQYIAGKFEQFQKY